MSQTKNGGDALARVAAIRKQVLARRSEISSSLPKSLQFDFWMKSVEAAFCESPDLLLCTPTSIMRSTMNSAFVGLPPNHALGLAAFVVFRDTKRGVTDCQFMPMVKGLVALAKRSGEIKDIQTRVVYAGDEFQVEWGTEPRIVHRPTSKSDRSKIEAAYSVAWLKDGSYSFEVVWAEDISAARAVAKTKNVWDSWPGEMARKTAFKRHSKWLPGADELVRAINLDNELSDMTPTRDVDPLVAPRSRADQVADVLGAEPEVGPPAAEQEPDGPAPGPEDQSPPDAEEGDAGDDPAIQKAFDGGVRCRLAGIPIDRNPHNDVSDHLRWAAWRGGWGQQDEGSAS